MIEIVKLNWNWNYLEKNYIETRTEMNSDTHTQLILKWLVPYFMITKTEMILYWNITGLIPEIIRFGGS